MMCSLATKLADTELAEITSLEQELGVTLLAFSCHDMRPVQASPDQLAKIQQLEGKLGMSLVAVNV
jgi:hypothetical protein